jgi:hypothetical protein
MTGSATSNRVREWECLLLGLLAGFLLGVLWEIL